MAQGELTALIEIFSQVRDFRSPQRRRHPLSALLTLVFLGLLARIREMAVLQRWTEDNWELLREPLGFTHKERPHATTISRVLTNCSLADFSQAFTRWLRQMALYGQPPRAQPI